MERHVFQAGTCCPTSASSDATSRPASRSESSTSSIVIPLAASARWSASDAARASPSLVAPLSRARILRIFSIALPPSFSFSAMARSFLDSACPNASPLASACLPDMRPRPSASSRASVSEPAARPSFRRGRNRRAEHDLLSGRSKPRGSGACQ